SPHINKYLYCDMATAANALQPFLGNINENFKKWLHTFNLICRIFNPNEDEKLKLLILKIQGNAQLLVAKYVETNTNHKFQDIINYLLKTFRFVENDLSDLKQLVGAKEPMSLPEYYGILETATNIYFANLMSEEKLIKLTITKLPTAVQSALFHHTQNESSMLAFLAEAKNISWCIYANNIIDNESNSSKTLILEKNSTPAKNRINKWYCRIHNFCNHKTIDCNTIRKMKSQNLLITKKAILTRKKLKINQNKITRKYEKKSVQKSPFHKIIKLENQSKIPALIDTGADVSLIEKKNGAEKL
ncbi:hypothetical protein COBT_003825, partial [Conglomerata obtusa]